MGRIQRYRYFFFRARLLIQYSSRDAVDRRLKKFGYIGPSAVFHSANTKREKQDPYPSNFSWPIRMLTAASLSRVDPNLMNCGSSGFENLSFVVLSKQFVICSISSL